MIEIKLSKVISEQSTFQFQYLSEILGYAGLSDQLVSVFASISAARVTALPEEFARVPDWSRTVSGQLSLDHLSTALLNERLLNLKTVDVSGVEVLIRPDFNLPWYDWDGGCPNLFRVETRVPIGASASKTLKDFKGRQGTSLKHKMTEFHQEGKITISHSLEFIGRQDLAEVFSWLIGNYKLATLQSVSATFTGMLMDLPGFSNEACPLKSSFDDKVFFGALAYDPKTLVINQPLVWAKKFAVAMQSLSDEFLWLTIRRRYLRWPTSSCGPARGTSQNAVYLDIDYSTSELGVQFEQFAAQDVHVSQVKNAFQKFWSFRSESSGNQ